MCLVQDSKYISLLQKLIQVHINMLSNIGTKLIKSHKIKNAVDNKFI